MAALAKLQSGPQAPTGHLHADTVARIEMLAADVAWDVRAEAKRLSDTGALPSRIYLYAANRLGLAQQRLGEHTSSAVAAQALHSRFLQLVEA